MCLIHDVPVYITPGAVTHSVIAQQFGDGRTINIDFEYYWQSMLENWALVNRIYQRECCGDKIRKLSYCLLRMSRPLNFMIDAMVEVRSFKGEIATKIFIVSFKRYSKTI